MSLAQRLALTVFGAQDGSTLRTNNTRREQADPVRNHQFDYTFRLPELQSVATTAATWLSPGSAEDDATAASQNSADLLAGKKTAAVCGTVEYVICGHHTD